MQWLYRQLHPSWLVMWLSLAVITGIGLPVVLPESYHGVSWLVACLTMLALAFINRTVAVIALILLAGIGIGLWRSTVEQYGLRAYRPYFNRTVVVDGVVSEDASLGTRGDQQLVLSAVHLQGKPVPGHIWASLPTALDIRRSDRITLQGTLLPGFGSLAGSMFRARIIHAERPQPGDIGLRLRDWFAGGIRAAIAEPEASLASGYLVGQRSNLPADLDMQLKTVGLTHAVVASGYNLTILVSLARQLLLSVSKYLATLSAVGMIALFVAMSGLSPSMLRAGLVTGLGLAAWFYGRAFHPLVLLPLAAAITALLNPAYVWGDIGWYLSFTSFAGVIVLAPLIRRALWNGSKQPNFFMQIVVDTMSAQIATLPIMIFAFGHYSPYALPANILVLPLVPLAMLLTFIGGAVGVILPALAHSAGWPAYMVLHYMTSIVAHIANLPGAQGNASISPMIVLLAYAAIAIMVIGLWRRTRYNFRADIEPPADAA